VDRGPVTYPERATVHSVLSDRIDWVSHRFAGDPGDSGAGGHVPFLV